MSYMLESAEEFERLERQNTMGPYDYRMDMRGFAPVPRAVILDAGSGSGVVSRFLAQCHPDVSVHGVDASIERVEQATRAARGLPNVRFTQGDLSQLDLADASVDHVVCRFVLQHVPGAKVAAVLSEFLRVLKPGGSVHLIDQDGFLDNMYPLDPPLAQAMAMMKAQPFIDMWIGRKLPTLLSAAGFRAIDWRIDLMDFQGAAKDAEIENFKLRFAIGAAAFDAALGKPGACAELERCLSERLALPDTVLYYNKFVVSALK